MFPCRRQIPLLRTNSPADLFGPPQLIRTVDTDAKLASFLPSAQMLISSVLSGLGYTASWRAGAFQLCKRSISGVPPFSCKFSKRTCKLQAEGKYFLKRRASCNGRILLRSYSPFGRCFQEDHWKKGTPLRMLSFLSSKCLNAGPASIFITRTACPVCP